MIQKIKAKIYAICFWQTGFGEILNKIVDLKIFYQYSFTEKKQNSQESLRAFLTKQYHIIEKGLALPNPRAGFGKPKIELLIYKSNNYIAQYGSDDLIINIKETLKSYLNKNQNLEKSDLIFYKLTSNFVANISTSKNGGTKFVTKSEIKNSINLDFESFIKSRSSVRNFDESNILPEKIQKAVELARFAPSVCNRQSWKLHYYKDKKLKNELLKLQAGSNGFTDSINQLLIITTDTKNFTKLESNQVYVDGGLFAMSLLLSLHSQEIASCCLNTCVTYVVEQKIKKLGKIPKSQKLIMMVGIGNFKENYEVAISNRFAVNEILTQH
ncbi:MAG: nitroreductase family protein [Flavobacterium sp.]|nr:nitroreductase family protein [Flavobacterium sp.]